MLENVFLTSAPPGGRGPIFAKSLLSGNQALKTYLYAKIRDPIFHRIARAVLSQLMSGRTLYTYMASSCE